MGKYDHDFSEEEIQEAWERANFLPEDIDKDPDEWRMTPDSQVIIRRDLFNEDEKHGWYIDDEGDPRPIERPYPPSSSGSDGMSRGKQDEISGAISKLKSSVSNVKSGAHRNVERSLELSADIQKSILQVLDGLNQKVKSIEERLDDTN